ncbi:MAG TPA: DUF3631 domain-containing protein [Candidatus Angelobacter sp.]
MPVETLNTTTPDNTEVASDHELEMPITGAGLLDDIDRFIGRYLECSDHQRIVMAFWVLHTYCLSVAQVTPYLAIQSAEHQSGKSLCLQLLSMISPDSALTTAYTAASLARRTDDPIPTVLLDEFQATIGTRTRSKSPVLRAVLASGFQPGVGYTTATRELNLFAPKAFAGMGQLPDDIADRSISIVLEPFTAKSKVRRFDLLRATEEADDLRARLHSWSQGALASLKKKPPYTYDKFPPGLDPRQQDMVEPLLQIADFLGEGWPEIIREALAAIFQDAVDFDLKESLQLLADVRDCFAHHGWVERLSTSDLLTWLHTRDTRPWDVDGRITARRLARLLHPFEILPRVQRTDKKKLARGYQLQDFIEHWQEHLNFEVPATVTHAAQSEIVNKDAHCYAVTDSRADSQISADQRESVPARRGSAVKNSGVGVGVDSSVISGLLPVASQVVTHSSGSEIANKDVDCYAVTDSRAHFQISPDQRISA